MPAAISEPGSVEKGQRGRAYVLGAAAWDYHSSGSHFLQWRRLKVNIVDARHMDFLAEVYRSLAV